MGKSAEAGWRQISPHHPIYSLTSICRTSPPPLLAPTAVATQICGCDGGGCRGTKTDSKSRGYV